jgi:hypothetical protein
MVDCIEERLSIRINCIYGRLLKSQKVLSMRNSKMLEYHAAANEARGLCHVSSETSSFYLALTYCSNEVSFLLVSHCSIEP